MITLNGKPINVTHFPDGTSQVWKIDDAILSQQLALVHWRFENEAEVMHLAQLAWLLRASGVHYSRLVIDYLPYARQDKEVANDATFALRVFAPMLNLMQWNLVTLYDPHSAVAEQLIDRSHALYFTATVVACLTAHADVLCFPDAGAKAKYAPMFGGYRRVTASKVRDSWTGRVSTGAIDGDVSGQRVLIVDDICDGGATFIGLAAKLREAGAKDVLLFVSHGLFTRGVKALTDAGISRVFTPTGETLP